MKIIGHQNNIHLINETAKNNSWSHSYLFIGPNMIGKGLVAKYTAQLILNREIKDNDPDVLNIEIEKEANNISIDQIRKIKDFLSLKPFSASRQCVVINNADTMANEAANAFLKTLEEPSSAVIILLSKSKNSVPQTILSRCQTLFFYPLSIQEINEFIKDYKIKSEYLDFIIKASGGRPGWIDQVVKDKAVESLFNFSNSLAKSFNGNLAEKIALVKEIYESEDYARIIEAYLFSHLDSKNSKYLNRALNTYSLVTDSRYNHRLALENMLIG